ncbi:MAG: HD domain-containing protein [Clostridia bacterium]|nr:HD domain-containing protein [Clostridia bacterium]
MQEVAQKIKQAGGTLYLVGGAIRDRLLNLPVTDKDYCVTGLTKGKFQTLFPEAKIQGKDFPVFILNQTEIALARKERKIGKGHKEFEFLTSPEINIEEDLARRDLTINSIAQDILTGEIIDPFQGREDIKKRVLRKTTDAFTEDPLRVYRVARFMATLDNGFNIDTETLEAMQKLKSELPTLSKERVFTEFRKAISSSKPSLFFETLKQANVLEVHFPEIADLIGQAQPEKYHPEGDSYNHTMIVVDNSSKLTDNLAIRFSCLVHDIGKGITPKDMLPHHYGHDEKGIKLVQRLGNRIGVPNFWIKCGKTAAKWHMKGGIFEQMTPKKQVELIENIAKSMLGLEGLKIVVACDKNRNRQDLQTTFHQIEFAKLGEECLKQISGEKMQQKYPNLAGKAFGEKLHEERINWIKSIDRN